MSLMRPAALAWAVALTIATAAGARAATCTATMTDINFGSISVRSGVTNATSGTMQIDCSGAGVLPIGACIRFGPGSGGAGAGNSPRYMRRADAASLNFELRATGNGPAHGTWNEAFVLIPVVAGSGSAVVTVYADITSSGVSVGTGPYSSVFSGAAHASVEYDVASCAASGPVAVPNAFTVSADVQSSCEVDAASLDFGAIPPVLSAPVDREADLTVRCTSSTGYAIRLDNGSGAGATGPTDRRMSSGPSSISYGLYQNSARTAPWGNDPGNDVGGTGAGNDQTYTVYGRIHAGQTLQAGIYSDAVVVTVEYE